VKGWGVDSTARYTSLHKSPFWVLGTSSRDDRQRIVQSADDKSLELDHDLCQRARSDLTNPRTRLAAEIAWLPGVSPVKAEQLATRVLTEPMAIETGIPALAHLNLRVAAFESLHDQFQPNDVATFIQELASSIDALVVADIQRDINEDRAVSGFPEITGEDQIETELVNRKRHIRDAIKNRLNQFPTTTIVSAMTQAVDAATGNGKFHASELIDELVDVYEVEAHEFLQREAANIAKLVETARSVADHDPRSAGEIVDRIDKVARNWDKVAQPIQVSARARGISHGPSKELAFQIRGLAVDLFNKHDMVAQSQRLTDLLREVFAEIPRVAEIAEEDADAIEGIVESRDKWNREITYEAEVGIAFKNTLRISPEGISWKEKNYALADITRVRWGGVSQSVNGIPVGTTYTLAFGNDRSETVVQLRREEVYSTFLEKLRRAVCARLVKEMAATLKTGRELDFSDAVVRDECVFLKKHKWFGSSERVRCAWHEVKIWSVNGMFVIGSQSDEKTNAGLSYIHVANVHILESLIRFALRRSYNRLSDILEDE
jgi:hypothetical protein